MVDTVEVLKKALDELQAQLSRLQLYSTSMTYRVMVLEAQVAAAAVREAQAKAEIEQFLFLLNLKGGQTP